MRRQAVGTILSPAQSTREVCLTPACAGLLSGKSRSVTVPVCDELRGCLSVSGSNVLGNRARTTHTRTHTGCGRDKLAFTTRRCCSRRRYTNAEFTLSTCRAIRVEDDIRMPQTDTDSECPILSFLWSLLTELTLVLWCFSKVQTIYKTRQSRFCRA